MLNQSLCPNFLFFVFLFFCMKLEKLIFFVNTYHVALGWIHFQVKVFKLGTTIRLWFFKPSAFCSLDPFWLKHLLILVCRVQQCTSCVKMNFAFLILSSRLVYSSSFNQLCVAPINLIIFSLVKQIIIVIGNWYI